VYKGEPTPMDLVIVDDHEVLLSFPIHHEVPEFFDAVLINESRLVRACRTVFSLLELNSMKIEDAQGNTRLGVPDYLKVQSKNLQNLNS
jgi:hypothetical protein